MARSAENEAGKPACGTERNGRRPGITEMAGEISGYLPAGLCSGQPGGTGGAGMAGNSPHGA